MLYDRRVELDEVGKAMYRLADVLEERGWCQRNFQNKKGAYCVVGAIYLLNETVYSDCDSAVVMVRRLLTYLQVSSLSLWNDTPGRTKEEVVSAFREAAYLK